MSDAREWYLVQTKSRQERLAQDNLERQGYATWLPRLRVRGRRGTRIEALFPGYLFVELLPHRDNFAPIRSTTGALRLVQFGPVYARVPANLIADLKANAAADGICEPLQRMPHPGERVELVDGALAGYQAIVTSLRGRERIALLLEIAGRYANIVTQLDAVQLV